MTYSATLQSANGRTLSTRVPARAKAALIHFAVSLLIFSAVLFVLLQYWYPAPFFSASGGWQGIKLVAFVDIVLGPLLTFVAFNTNKPKHLLKMDLSFIAAAQIAALVIGINIVYQQRPVALVYWENTFMTVPAAAISEQANSDKILQTLGRGSPALIYAEKPIDENGRTQMLSKVTDERIPPHEQITLYRNFKTNFSRIADFEVDIESIISHNAEMKLALKKILNDHQRELGDFHYYPLKSRYNNIILVFNHQAEIVGYISAPSA